LKRIRDNQRRSRARRKDHLKSLEQRIRQNERQGIEVAKEIQVAARHVLEQNGKLRKLLVESRQPLPQSEESNKLNALLQSLGPKMPSYSDRLHNQVALPRIVEPPERLMDSSSGWESSPGERLKNAASENSQMAVLDATSLPIGVSSIAYEYHNSLDMQASTWIGYATGNTPPTPKSTPTGSFLKMYPSSSAIIELGTTCEDFPTDANTASVCVRSQRS
jgi:hypothetical protein